jgi:hypothetical protein
MNQVALLLLNKKWIWIWKREKLQRVRKLEWESYGTLHSANSFSPHSPPNMKQTKHHTTKTSSPFSIHQNKCYESDLGDVLDFGRLFLSLSLLQKSQPNVRCELWLDPIPSSQYTFPHSDFSCCREVAIVVWVWAKNGQPGTKKKKNVRWKKKEWRRRKECGCVEMRERRECFLLMIKTS